MLYIFLTIKEIGPLKSVLKAAQAGTFESNDVMIFVEPGTSGLEVDLESIVKKQYGPAIERTIVETIKDFGLTDLRVKVIDKGALDYAIRSRLVTALKRATVETERG
jgi:citrate lyase subunit gamma (acyl carrier protein)